MGMMDLEKRGPLEAFGHVTRVKSGDVSFNHRPFQEFLETLNLTFALNVSLYKVMKLFRHDAMSETRTHDRSLRDLVRKD
jgi:hypothetical protein